MDLLDFRLIRRPRLDSTPIAPIVADGDLVESIANEATPPDKGAAPPKGGGRKARAKTKSAAKKTSKALADWRAREQDPLGWSAEGHAAETIEEKTFVRLGEADRWLTAQADDPTGADFKAFRTAIVKVAGKSFDAAALATARNTLGNALAAAYVSTAKDRIPALQRLTRLLLVLNVMDSDAVSNAQLDAPPERGLVRQLLTSQAVLLPQALNAAAPSGPLVELVREAKVSDLFVVRSEWSCYKAAEIASILNVFAGETLEQESKITREEETIDRTETDRFESSEQTEEDKSQSELSREVQKAASLQVNAEGSVNVSGSYGVVKFGASASVGASASLAENSRTASKISRELISRAVSKVESRVREDRMRRRLTKSEDLTRHTVDNDGGAHARGIYRWVDRIDRYQVFRFPDRLLFEFQIPEPAEYVRWRIRNRVKGDEVSTPEPPEFDVNATQITPATYGALALKYRASSIPPPPDEFLSVTYAASAASQMPVPPDRGTKPFGAPMVEKSGSATVPKGYRATQVSFSVSALPFRANWRVEGNASDPPDNKTDVEGFHHITAFVHAGGSALRSDKPSNQTFTVQLSSELSSEDRSRIPYSNAVLSRTGAIPFTRPIQDKVDIGLTVAGASSASISAEIQCRRTGEALAEWQQSVYDGLLSAWQGWQQAWKTEQLQKLGPRLTGVDATSPARNRETILEELKRQVIAWLFDDSAFAGYDDLLVAPAGNWRRYDLADARQHASTIQFIEQAFEWGNLTYVLYPYYWAGSGRWNDLADLEGADPEFIRFLRSGSARVIVPARPGFELATVNWMLYRTPWNGNPMPAPGDPLYVSIATEISDLTRGPQDGEPGDCWESRLSTTLVYLDPSDQLPANGARRLGKAPNEPADPIC